MSFGAITFVIAATCTSPSLGIEITGISHAYRAQHHVPDYVAGALVRTTKGALLAGDVIQGIDRDLIQNACDLASRVTNHGCGEVTLSVYRDGSTKSMTVSVISSASTSNKPHTCDDGDPEACYVLGLKLTDDKAKKDAYEQACDGGYSQACTNLGWMYENARAVNQDLAAAARLYRKGCDGSPCSAPNNLGCTNLAKAFRAGMGVEKNDVIATRLFRDVCRRTPVPGSDDDAATIANACSLTGTALVLGQGVPQNAKEGMTLLEKGCAGDDVFGCYNLGAFYETGTGVAADRKRAVTYYARACEHGDTEACERAGLLKK